MFFLCCKKTMTIEILWKLWERLDAMKTKIFSLFLLVWVLLLAAACGAQEPPPASGGSEEAGGGTVQLTVWGAEEDEALLQEIFASFQARYAGQANFQITYQPQSESNCKDVLLGNLEGGADVFAFADDQVAALAAAGGSRRPGPHWGGGGHPKGQPLRGGGGGQRGGLPLRVPPHCG